MKKGDIIIFTAILLAGLSLWMLGKFCLPKNNVYVVSIDGKEVYTGYLSEDKTVDLAVYGADNVLKVKEGTVSVISSSCKNQVCVHTGAISGSGQIICCLPHKLVISIRGKGDIDAATY